MSKHLLMIDFGRKTSVVGSFAHWRGMKGYVLGLNSVLVLLKSFILQVQHKLNSYAISAVGMGTWRLRPWSSLLIQNTVAHVEGAWRHFVDDLGLYGLKRVIHFAPPCALPRSTELGTPPDRAM